MSARCHAHSWPAPIGDAGACAPTPAARSLAIVSPVGAQLTPSPPSYSPSPPLSAQVGSKIPSIELDHGFAGSDGTKVNLSERAAGKKIILVGLPGAFTPT